VSTTRRQKKKAENFLADNTHNRANQQHASKSKRRPLSVGEMREGFWGGFCANQLRISGKIPSESLIA
jgi:hypothetical protein